MSSWQKLESSPNAGIYEILIINEYEFAVVPNAAVSHSIHKYNIKDNAWIKVMDYDRNLHSSLHCAACDIKNGLIYVADIQQQLLEFDLNSRSMIILTQKNESFKIFVHMICVDDVIHLIDSEGSHHVLQKSQQQLNIIHQLTADLNHYIPNLLHIKSQKSLILLSVDNWKAAEFDITGNKWREVYDISPIHPTKSLMEVATVCTRNEEHILVFGGYETDSLTKRTRIVDSIFIYNVKVKNFVKSRVRCPLIGKCYVTIMKDDYRDNLMAFGFVNQCFASSEFVNVHKLPISLIMLIADKISNEWIYYIHADREKDEDDDKDKDELEHYRIHVDRIFGY